MKMCMNFDRHRGPHHFRRGMDHFRGHKHHEGGHPYWKFCHRGREGPKHHGGPPGFSHAPPSTMFMGPNCHHHPHHLQPDHYRFQENRPNCHHHCRKNNDRPRHQPLEGRPLSCPPFGRPPFGNDPFDRSRRGREPFEHFFELDGCHLHHRRDGKNRDCGHCGNSSAAR